MARDHKDGSRSSSSCVEVKLLLAAIFSVGALAAVFQLLPFHTTSFCTSPRLAVVKADEQEAPPDVRRAFRPVGSAAYLFVQMGAYRGGPRTFAVVGLASKPLHVFGDPQFLCSWVPHGDGPGANLTAVGAKILPDWGYGRVYTVVVVNCTFPAGTNPGADASGGRLFLTATVGTTAGAAETFVALEEASGATNMSAFAAPPKYDYLYCGAPLYGDLSPQRLREWLAYHAWLLGAASGRAHFVLHDAGGAHPAVMDVLRPWVDRGVVTLQDVRDQERFDGYYHNQFLVLNDCLHRYRFDARWMFFFDVDEFLFVDEGTTLPALLTELTRYAQFTFPQMPMSGKICRSDDAAEASTLARMWGFEKLVYRDVRRGVRRDRKYAVQPRQAFAAGVHLSQNVAGRTRHTTDGRVRYFHYHGTVARRGEPCEELANATEVRSGRTPYGRDETLRRIVGAVKRFEADTIGWLLEHTPQ